MHRCVNDTSAFISYIPSMPHEYSKRILFNDFSALLFSENGQLIFLTLDDVAQTHAASIVNNNAAS